MAFGQIDYPVFGTRSPAAIAAFNAGKAANNAYNTRSAYDPYSVSMTQAGGEADQQRLAAQAAWQAQQAAAQQHGQATNAGLEGLKQEMARNEDEIAQLRQELATLSAELGDQDSLDMALAANRAKIGDMGNSLAHQQNMQWRWQQNNIKDSDSIKLKQKEAKDLIGQIEDAEIAMQMGGNAERPAWEAKIARLKRELAENPYGKQYGVKSESEAKAEQAEASAENGKETPEQSKYRSLDDARILANKFITKDGLISAAGKKQVLAALDSLPANVRNTVDVSDYRKSIANMKTTEQQAADNAASEAKDKAALDKFKNDVKSFNNIDFLFRENEIPSEVNGRKVTVTRDVDGYTVKIGKQTYKFSR